MRCLNGMFSPDQPCYLNGSTVFLYGDWTGLCDISYAMIMAKKITIETLAVMIQNGLGKLPQRKKWMKDLMQLMENLKQLMEHSKQ